MKIIVHFGMVKTGSSSIQHTLYQNRHHLKNIYYPDFGLPNHSPIMFSILRGQNKDNIERLKKSLMASEGRDFLLSAEMLGGSFNYDQVKSLHSLLVDYSNEIIGVGYIRPPKALMESAFQQKMKTGRIKRRFLKEGGNGPGYQKSYEKFDTIFGRENVYFWKFDPAKFPNGCVVTDFCQRLNIDISPDAIVRINEGLSLQSIGLLYTYLRYGRKLILNSVGEKRFPLLVDLVGQIQGKKLHFASELIAPIIEAGRSEIEWIENRMGASLAEDIFKNDANAIHSEAELIASAQEATQWLAEQLGPDYIKRWHPQMSVQEIAGWMHVLRIKSEYQNKLVKKTAKEPAKKIVLAKKRHTKIVNN